MIPQYFRALQHYFLQCYYKANLEFNLDNRFGWYSLSFSPLKEKKSIMKYHHSPWLARLAIRLRYLFTKS